jgi:hypothetical protein
VDRSDARFTALQTSVNAVSANVTNETTARISGDTTNAGNIAAVSTTVAGHTASITAVQNSINGLLLKYSVTLDSNGYMTGYTINNNGSTGTFKIHSDYFSIGKSSTGARTEFSSGNWRVYDASNVLRVRLGVW